MLLFQTGSESAKRTRVDLLLTTREIQTLDLGSESFAAMTPVSWVKFVMLWPLNIQKEDDMVEVAWKAISCQEGSPNQTLLLSQQRATENPKRGLFCGNVAYLLLCHPLTLPFGPIWWPFPAKRAEWAFTACELNSCSFLPDCNHFIAQSAAKGKERKRGLESDSMPTLQTLWSTVRDFDLGVFESPARALQLAP